MVLSVRSATSTNHLFFPLALGPFKNFSQIVLAPIKLPHALSIPCYICNVLCNAHDMLSWNSAYYEMHVTCHG
jgi:hypothetical protein